MASNLILEELGYLAAHSSAVAQYIIDSGVQMVELRRIFRREEPFLAVAQHQRYPIFPESSDSEDSDNFDDLSVDPASSEDDDNDEEISDFTARVCLETENATVDHIAVEILDIDITIKDVPSIENETNDQAKTSEMEVIDLTENENMDVTGEKVICATSNDLTVDLTSSDDDDDEVRRLGV